GDRRHRCDHTRTRGVHPTGHRDSLRHDVHVARCHVLRRLEACGERRRTGSSGNRRDGRRLTTKIELTRSDELTRAIVVTADRFNVRPEELLEHLIWWKHSIKLGVI